MAVAVGQRIEARCTRCKDIMGHVVVAMVGDEIAKVECCACGSVHKYHEPAKKKEKIEAKPVRVRAGEERSAAVKESSSRTARIAGSAERAEKKESVKKVTVSKSEKANLKTLEEMQAKWKDRMVSFSDNAKPYSMDAVLEKDDFVEHSVFGIGIVLETYAPNKADILFSAGIKSLRCTCA